MTNTMLDAALDCTGSDQRHTHDSTKFDLFGDHMHVETHVDDGHVPGPRTDLVLG